MEKVKFLALEYNAGVYEKADSFDSAAFLDDRYRDAGELEFIKRGRCLSDSWDDCEKWEEFYSDVNGRPVKMIAKKENKKTYYKVGNDIEEIINSLSSEEREELKRLLEEGYEYIKFDILITNSIYKIEFEGLTTLPFYWDETSEVIAYAVEVKSRLEGEL